MKYSFLFCNFYFHVDGLELEDWVVSLRYPLKGAALSCLGHRAHRGHRGHRGRDLHRLRLADGLEGPVVAVHVLPHSSGGLGPSQAVLPNGVARLIGRPVLEPVELPGDGDVGVAEEPVPVVLLGEGIGQEWGDSLGTYQ